MQKYKEQWENYFNGEVTMWSYYGYSYHSYLITKYIVSRLDLPQEGKIVQIGTGLGITIELLCNLFEPDRVIGYDLFNPLNHPNIRFLDINFNLPPENKIAYLEIDVGDVKTFKKQRNKVLNWACNNMVPGGYILTNKILALDFNNDVLKQEVRIIQLEDFDIPEL
jgi:hypothetical protein